VGESFVQFGDAHNTDTGVGAATSGLLITVVPAFCGAGFRAPKSALKITQAQKKMMNSAPRELLAPACLTRFRRSFISGGSGSRYPISVSY
jgi:hypothetical protein